MEYSSKLVSANINMCTNTNGATKKLLVFVKNSVNIAPLFLADKPQQPLLTVSLPAAVMILIISY